MYDGEQLKYGQVSGGEGGFSVVVAADQTIPAASGKFVKRTGASTATVTLMGAGDTEPMGHLEIEEVTDTSTDGTEVRKCVDDLTAVFRIPINGGTFYEYMKGKKCDLSIASTIQGAALNSTADGVVIIVEGDETNSKWVDVRLNPAKIAQVATA